jgi:hypothetical protein
MLREEAIAILEAFTENPLFSDVHKAAFNIAIHDIKQRHNWDINNLILINKENYEPAEQESILDKIRAEIDKIYERENHSFDCLDVLDELKEFIEKTWAESEK